MPADLSFLRSPKVIIGGVLLVVMGAACACSSVDGDDDCDSMGPTGAVFAAGSSGVRLAAPGETSTAALPSTGGFGTHLASCGG